MIRILLDNEADPKALCLGRYNILGCYLFGRENNNDVLPVQLDTIKCFQKHGVDINGLQGGENNQKNLEQLINNSEFKKYIKKFKFKKGGSKKKRLESAIKSYFKELDRTPLMLACENRQLELVKILLKAGADITVLCKGSPTSDRKFSALDIAIYKKEVDIALSLLFYSEQILPLSYLELAYETLLYVFQEQSKKIIAKYQTLKFDSNATIDFLGIENAPIFQPKNIPIALQKLEMETDIGLNLSLIRLANAFPNTESELRADNRCRNPNIAHLKASKLS